MNKWLGPVAWVAAGIALNAAALHVALSKSPAAAPSVAATADSGADAHAAWMRPQNFRNMLKQSAFVARARVIEIRPGDPIVIDDPDHPMRIPTERVSFERLASLAGDAPTNFTVFRTGSKSFTVEGEPAYQPGEIYVIFAQAREIAGEYLPAGPDGRLLESNDERLQTFIGGGAADEVSGRTVGELRRMIESERRRP